MPGLCPQLLTVSCPVPEAPVLLRMNRWDHLSRHRALPNRCLGTLTMSGAEDVISRVLDSWSPPGLLPEPPALATPSMRSETSRLRSFRLWPAGAPHLSLAELARAGFYYLGPGDRVQCFCCGGVLRSWEPEDRPHAEHRKFFPNCPFIHGMEVGNLPQMAGVDSVDGQILGQFQHLSEGEEDEGPWQAIYPEMMEERERLATYRDWPPNAGVTPDQLARAGFFYTGNRDKVKCFHCDGGLWNWERGDDPWREHAKWFPRCEFLVHSMGQEYVRRAQESHFSSPEASPDFQHPSVSSPSSLADSPDWDAFLRSSIVQGALQMGFDQSLVSSLVQSRVLLTGTPYSSVSELVTDLVQAEEEAAAAHRAGPARITDVPAQRERSDVQRQKEPESSQSMEEQLRRLKEERMCKVCMDKDVSMVFVPCGHLVVCTDCAPNLRHCPICRAVIRGSVRAFMS
ncbi:baculoviral IAP repeat-containing protein 7 [Spea bombifrons]|uniref:baculoviral IAP repeat-containing protein 7 n=1 Tax=Spea bombifrons TaxID=233779 RepID=UPI00234B9B42|nr:baculoviral IAP repeat-containing protein 7 [Spea bombifrons]